MDLCFELAMQIMARIGDAVSPVDEVHSFRYFDDRDLMGFVDGTENPRGEAVIDAVIVGEEDAAFARVRVADGSAGSDHACRSGDGRLAGDLRRVRKGDSAGPGARRSGARPAKREETGSACHGGDKGC
jgi:hypothetical protein